MSFPVLRIKLQVEHDIVLARQHARAIAESLGFDRNDQSRLATAVSEIARNAFRYAGGGDLEFSVEGRQKPQMFAVKISDRGPGIADLEAILEGRYRSRTGLGRGLLGAKRLMEVFHIESTAASGTTVVLGRFLPQTAPLVAAERAQEIADALARVAFGDPFSEIQQQNQELLQALAEIRQQKERLEELNRELSDTNRGMVALYAELDEKAASLQKANELKGRFLSNVSHEFRTPLNSVLALARLLLDRVDGALTEEQERQVGFIRKSAEDLSSLVNDLLDLAKIEAGRISIQASEFEIVHLCSALRGMLKPLLTNPAVSLVFEVSEDLSPLYTDESKVAQILRNLISNALKFTERGEVRVTASLLPGSRCVEFSVADTGIGIAPEDHGRIFEEYGQIDSPIQRRVRGTGLGLPLSRKLAELLGGSLTVQSVPNCGSTFRATIPQVYAGPAGAIGPAPRAEIGHASAPPYDRPEVKEASP
jgi:signal transduction histidine kinase